MTLILGLRCQEGVVIAADSAAEEAGGVKWQAAKVWQLGDRPILCGGSGDVGLIQTVQECLDGFNAVRPKFKDTRQELRKRVIPALQEAASSHVPLPYQGHQGPPTATLLVGGYNHDFPFLLEIEKDGRATMYHDDAGNFCAIGSGKPWAHAIYRPFWGVEHDLRRCRVLACRVVGDAINIAASGLAAPIRIYEITPDKGCRELPPEDVQALEGACGMWLEMQRDTFDGLVRKFYDGAGDEAAAAPEVPEPPQP